MKRLPAVLCTLLLFPLIILSGCSSTSVTKTDKPLTLNQQTDFKSPNSHPALSSPAVASKAVHATLSENDKRFIKGIKASLHHAQQVISQLKIIVSTSQQTDELDAAQENMNSAKREILYIWNQIHNEYQPDGTNLKKIKTAYENILMDYRKGLSIQIQGIETTGGTRVMEGLQLTDKAEEDLNKLSTTIIKLG
ncbi:hypothetical protein PP175_02470 [Aneurinibacillus sp. Ricciae_BoGa-3]|uniref:hypothetical protein n=1 Tax=Aneurinibacillus sp. Ricciae_BoGa-3 TaxID=3022697 RepID=UPI00234071DF|nr:hypothetical protein [Aneurinibacillus sp. Ricciae_BoGa-3]WCK54898.1 hypothetical protein PP175_02470 [Aneurinibacillus sp. Ricciae_BoGa-3]